MASLSFRYCVVSVAGGLASAVALACSSAENSHAPDTGSGGIGGSIATAFSQRAKEPDQAGGTGGRTAASSSRGDSPAGTGNDATLGDAAGAGGAAQGDSEVDPAHVECTFGETCVSKCTATTVSCGIESPGFACEFDGFVGASTTVACGERAVIGTACCGGCGCVPVEVYFDGTHCWEGVPQCTIDQFANKVFDPHAPTPPDAPPFTPPTNVPGSFYLGVAGTSGTVATGGAGGTVATVNGGDAGLSSAGADNGGNPDNEDVPTSGGGL